MQLRKNQVGSIWGLAYTLGTLGFMVFIALKIYPIYLNEMKLSRAVKSVASEMDPSAEIGSRAMKDNLQRWWNVEDIEIVKVSDIKMKPRPAGKVLSYEYVNQAEIFKNVYLSFHFAKEFPAGSGAKY